LSDFLTMGGYGAFVWASYAVSLLVVGGMALAVFLRARHVRRRLDALEGRLRGAQTEDASGSASPCR